jgi:hypothetical protein
MKRRPLLRKQFRVEELEARLVPSSAVSSNWSGYAVAAGPGSVNTVSATWVVPAVTGRGTAYSSTWVGIDGFNSSTVEQIGTDSDLYNGVPRYYAWYELYPSVSVELGLLVQPGDTIAAQVSYSSSHFTLQVSDGAQSFSITKSAPGAQRSSAEWVEEAPSSSSGILPLANFGTVSFSKAQTTIGTTTGAIDNSTWSNKTTSINMVSRTGATEAATGPLTDSGTPTTSKFSVAFVPTSTSSQHGSTGKGTSRQTDQPATSSAATTTGLAGTTQTTATQSTIPVPPSVASPIALIAPFALAGPAPVASQGAGSFTSGASFSQAGPAPLTVLPPLASSTGGTANQDAPQAPGPNDPDTPSSVQERGSKPEAVPLQSFEPLFEPAGAGEAAGGSERWQAPALGEQAEEGQLGVVQARDVVFSLALVGVGAFSAEHTRRRRRFQQHPRAVTE